MGMVYLLDAPARGAEGGSNVIKCDLRAKARCPFKTPCCGDEEAYFVEGSTCDKFNQEVLSPPPTNADHIRAMVDEELARFLDDTQYREWEEIQENRQELVDFRSCVEGWTEWLKQPYEEDKHG